VDAGNGLLHFEAEGRCAGRLQQLHRCDDAEVIVDGDGAREHQLFVVFKKKKWDESPLLHLFQVHSREIYGE
jgi:hypothetical protein